MSESGWTPSRNSRRKNAQHIGATFGDRKEELLAEDNYRWRFQVGS
jgi:hypothetical protein